VLLIGTLGRRRWLVVVSELVQQLLEGAAGIGIAGGPDRLCPVLFDLGDPVAGVVKRLAATPGGEDEFGAPVGGVRAGPSSPHVSGCRSGHARKRLRAFWLDSVTASQQAWRQLRPCGAVGLAVDGGPPLPTAAVDHRCAGGAG
jgi:hypothetical protein